MKKIISIIAMLFAFSFCNAQTMEVPKAVDNIDNMFTVTTLDGKQNQIYIPLPEDSDLLIEMRPIAYYKCIKDYVWECLDGWGCSILCDGGLNPICMTYWSGKCAHLYFEAKEIK